MSVCLFNTHRLAGQPCIISIHLLLKSWISQNLKRKSLVVPGLRGWNTMDLFFFFSKSNKDLLLNRLDIKFRWRRHACIPEWLATVVASSRSFLFALSFSTQAAAGTRMAAACLEGIWFMDQLQDRVRIYLPEQVRNAPLFLTGDASSLIISRVQTEFIFSPHFVCCFLNH